MSTGTKEFRAVNSSVHSHNPNAFSTAVLGTLMSPLFVMIIKFAFVVFEINFIFSVVLGIIGLGPLLLILWNYKVLFSTFRVKRVRIDYDRRQIVIHYAQGFSFFSDYSLSFEDMGFSYGKDTDFGGGSAFSPTMIVNGPDSSYSSSRSYICLTIKDLKKEKNFKIVADQRNWYGRPFRSLADELAKIKALEES